MASPARKRTKITSSDAEAEIVELTPRLPTSFLDLPAEVRVLIYNSLFSDLRIEIDYVNPFKAKPTSKVKLYRDGGFCLNILQTNSVIRKEARFVLEQQEPILVLRLPPDHTQARRLKNKIPEMWAAKIKKIQVPRPMNYNCCLYQLENLEEICLEHKVYHFQEKDRPADTTIMLQRVTGVVHARDHHVVAGAADFLWYANASVKVDRTLRVWYLNTQRNVSEGWEIEFDTQQNRVTSVQTAKFTKIRYNESRFDSRKLSRAQKNKAKCDWKLSANGWWIERHGNKVAID